MRASTNTIPDGNLAHGEEGVALVVVLLSSSLLLALGGGLVMLTTTESRIAATFRDGQVALYAAEAVLARAMVDLDGVADLDLVLTGARRSTFVDGAPAGSRTFAGGTVDLEAITNDERCGSPVCTVAAMNAVTDERPWGANNPRWQLFGYGPLSMLDAESPPGFYLAVWVGDDPLETDANPLADGVDPSPGAGRILIRAVAFGPHGVRRRVEVVAERSPGGFRVQSWRPLR